MFKEDISSLMPIINRDIDKINVKFYGNEKHIEKVISILISFSHYQVIFSHKDILCTAINTIARDIVERGNALYEIILDEQNDSLLVNNFSIHDVWSVPFYYLHINEEIRTNKFTLKKLSILNKKKVWNICIPQELGGYKEYRRTLKNLRKLNDIKDFSRFSDEIILNDNYDNEMYLSNKNIYRFFLTQKWGWCGRFGDNDKKTEYYNLFNSLKLKLAKTHFLNHIIKELNILFLGLGYDVEINILGLETPYDISCTMEAFKGGNISFGEIFDYF